MTKLARVALWFVAALILVLGVVTVMLIFPGRPADAHNLRFDGYIVLPKVRNAGALTMLDYLTVSGDELFVTSVSTGAVYKVGLHTRAMPESADVSVFESEPAAHGVIVDPTSHLAFVTRSEADTVDVFDPKTMRLVKRIPVAADPDGIFYDPSSKLVYVASSDAMLATLIDPASRNPIGTLSLGGKPEFAALDPETKLLYQNLADTNAVVAVDLTKRLIVQRWALEGCEMPTGMAIDAADRRLFIACGKSAKLAIFDLALHRVIASVPVGLGPDTVAYDPALHRIYVTGLSCEPGSFRYISRGRLHLPAFQRSHPGDRSGDAQTVCRLRQSRHPTAVGRVHAKSLAKPLRRTAGESQCSWMRYGFRQRRCG